MKIKLKYNWFASNGVLYKSGIVEIPDNLYDLLPSTATLVKDGTIETKMEGKIPTTLKDFDSERSNSDAMVEMLTKFEKEKGK